MNSKVKKLCSMALSIAMVIVLFMWNGLEAEAAIVENVEVSNVEKYDNGFLKSFALAYYVGYPSAGTPAPETPARVSVQTQKFTEDDFTEFGNYAQSHNYTDWPDVPADCGFITWNSDETFIRPASGNNHSRTISFAENAIDLNTSQTYYVYMWVYYDGGPGSHVYPDAYVYEFTTGTGDFTGSTTSPGSGGEQDPVTPPADSQTPSTDPFTCYTYYMYPTSEGCKLYEDASQKVEVPANRTLKYRDTIISTYEGGIHIYLGDALVETLSPLNSKYTIPDGEYTYSSSPGNFNEPFKFTLTRIMAPVTPPTDPVIPSVTPSVSGTQTSVVGVKAEEEAPTLTSPVLKSTNYAGDELASWQEVIDALVTIEPKKLTDSKPQDTESVLKVDISSTAGFVGHEVLQTLAKKDDASLHVFTGNGVALTFAGADMKEDAKAVRVTNQVSDKEENGKRVHIVDFLEKGKMEATVAFHVNLPQGANSSVEVYTENKDGVQNHIKTMKADSTGNMAFMIDSKEKFVFKY